MTPSKKSLPTGGDRFSNLPEAVISHILSCLPTRDAVRTCVLSKDWKYKWTFVYDYDIDDARSTKTAFVNFMHRILILSHDVRDFRLSCWGTYDGSCVKSWISVMLKHNIESLTIKYSNPGIILPSSLMSSTSLRKLELLMPCTLKFPAKDCFPNLKSLCLQGVEILNELFTSDKLIITFPVLETFEMTECKWLKVKFVEINAPALTTLKSKTPNDATRRNDYSIKIIGSRLRLFESSGSIPENLIVTGSQIVDAVFEYTGSISQRSLVLSGVLVQLVLGYEAFKRLEELKLSLLFAPAIRYMCQRQLRFPLNDKLRRLVLFSPDVISLQYTRALIQLLYTMPSLKSLVIDVDYWDDYNYDEVNNVPSCIVSHLEEVRLNNFRGKKCHLRLVKFLLKNGRQLKKFFLFGYGLAGKDELVEQLSTFPKASKCLIIGVS